MSYRFTNMVFEGGGVLGIAYLGLLDFMYQHNVFKPLKRLAGTSAGAITACVSCFNLPFQDLKSIADSLDYRKIPQSKIHSDLKHMPAYVKNEVEKIFGDVNSVYRLLKNFGWHSSDYLYHWLQGQIAQQFDATKKQPPYTFADFKNEDLHKSKRPFKDLYILGTNVSYKRSRIFSFETTPDMEVATAVRISMSIPLFFEAVKTPDPTIKKSTQTSVFADGGIMNNYPIGLFDSSIFKEPINNGVNKQTLGARFKSSSEYSEINNLLGYIMNLNFTLMRIQQDIYDNSPHDQARSIEIDTKDISSIDFDITANDRTYRFLYQQGYNAAQAFFS